MTLRISCSTGAMKSPRRSTESFVFAGRYVFIPSQRTGCPNEEFGYRANLGLRPDDPRRSRLARATGEGTVDMRRLFFAVLAALMLATSVPAAAITYGEVDSGRHPQVGLVVFLDAGSHPLWRCSGTLMSARVLLTAGHCTGADGADVPAKAVVWFTDNVPAGTGGTPG